MCRTLLSDVPNDLECLLGPRPTDANIRAVFSGVRTEDGRSDGLLHATEPSLLHCLTHRRIAFGDGASWRNPR